MYQKINFQKIAQRSFGHARFWEDRLFPLPKKQLCCFESCQEPDCKDAQTDNSHFGMIILPEFRIDANCNGCANAQGEEKNVKERFDIAHVGVIAYLISN